MRPAGEKTDPGLYFQGKKGQPEKNEFPSLLSSLLVFFPLTCPSSTLPVTFANAYLRPHICRDNILFHPSKSVFVDSDQTGLTLT